MECKCIDCFHNWTGYCVLDVHYISIDYDGVCECIKLEINTNNEALRGEGE